jgi:hypothetical protein
MSASDGPCHRAEALTIGTQTQQPLERGVVLRYADFHLTLTSNAPEEDAKVALPHGQTFAAQARVTFAPSNAQSSLLPLLQQLPT